MQRLRECGEAISRPRGGVTVVKIDTQRPRELVEQQPDATVRELHERLGVACDAEVFEAFVAQVLVPELRAGDAVPGQPLEP